MIPELIRLTVLIMAIIGMIGTARVLMRALREAYNDGCAWHVPALIIYAMITGLILESFLP